MKKYFLAIILIYILAIGNIIFITSDIQSVVIKNKIMRAYIKGVGNKTIVMLSGFGTDFPIDDFMPLAFKLSDDYRVVVLEYLGYGFSDPTGDVRTNEVMVQEIRTFLNRLDIKPPYILMPHSMSGIYSLYYASNYPSEVLGIIGIDMSLPQKQLERWSKETFEDVKIYQETSGLNISLVNQWNKFYDNSEELKDVKYPYDLPVLAFLATEQVDAVNEMIKTGDMRTSWVDINSNIRTNRNIQYVKILEGEHYLHHGQAHEIARISKEFIKCNC